MENIKYCKKKYEEKPCSTRFEVNPFLRSISKSKIQIFAPFILSFPTSAHAQAFKWWREQLHDPTLIYSRALPKRAKK